MTHVCRFRQDRWYSIERSTEFVAIVYQETSVHSIYDVDTPTLTGPRLENPTNHSSNQYIFVMTSRWTRYKCRWTRRKRKKNLKECPTATGQQQRVPGALDSAALDKDLLKLEKYTLIPGLRMTFFSGFNNARLVRKLVLAANCFQPASPWRSIPRVSEFLEEYHCSMALKKLRNPVILLEWHRLQDSILSQPEVLSG